MARLVRLEVALKRGTSRIGPVLRLAVIAAAAGAAGCVDLQKNNYFLPGGVDQSSPVAGQIAEAQRAPGPMPKFSDIPPAPTDVRPLSAWRAAVGETLADKRAIDADNSTYPYTLANTEAFAEAARTRIPAEEAAPPPDSTQAAEAYADALRSRANQPPPPK